MKRLLFTLIFLTFVYFSKAAQFYIPNNDITELKSAINTSNTNNSTDTIHLYPYGIYNLNTVDNNFVYGDNALPRITLDGSYNNSLTILGNGATLKIDDLIQNVRLLYLADCKINIYDVNFINGSADYDDDPGGAILLNASINSTEVSLHNCLFKGNSANEGGAIYISSGTMLIDNCTFTNNDAMFLGGAITNHSGIIIIKNSVIVNNVCTNTSGPGAVHNYAALNANTANNIYLQNSIVALNTYNNPAQPNNGVEYDLAQTTAVYTLENNFIVSYNNTTSGTNPIPFAAGLPSASNDYVGTSSDVIDPLLGAFERHSNYTPSYILMPGSLALNNNAGNRVDNNPKIASYGLFPQSVTHGTSLTIYGKNLSNITQVQFQGASVTSGLTTTDTSISLVVPAGARSGKILIFTANSLIALSDQELIVNVVSGIGKKIKIAGFTIYPNPVSDYLNVSTGGNRFSICDIFGKEVLSSKEERVDVSSFTPGIYVIQCGDEIKKFIKE